MNRTAKILAIILVIFVLIGAVASIAAQIYLAPFVKQQIEERGTAALGSPVTVKDLSIGLLPPLTAHASEIEFEIREKGLKAKIAKLSIHAQLTLSFNWRNAVRNLSIRVVEPEITYDLSAKPTPAAPAANESATGATSDNSGDSILNSLNLELSVERGRISVQDSGKQAYLVDPIDLNLNFRGLNSPIELTTKFELIATNLAPATRIPVNLKSTLNYDEITFSTESTSGEIAGAQFTLDGSQNLKTKSGEWKINAQANQLKTNSTFADLQIDGPVTAKLNSVIGILSNKPIVRQFSLDADLSATSLTYKKLFQKPEATLLTLKVSGSSDGESLQLSQAALVFDQLLANASGKIALPTSNQKLSKFSFNVSRTTLSGWERFLPSMSKAPVTGFIEASGSIAGNLQNPESLSIVVSPMKLEGIQGNIDWVSEDKLKTVVGPIALNGNVELVAAGRNLKSAKADLSANLSGLKILVKDSFNKDKGVPLTLGVHATQSPRGIEFKNTAIQLGSNQMRVAGLLQDPQRPRVNLTVSASKLSLGELSNILLAMKKYNLSGTANGDTKISGIYDFKMGIEKSPLSLSGSVTADLPSLTCPPPEESAAPNTPGPTSGTTPGTKTPKTNSPEPILPSWPAVKTAVFNAKISIGKLSCKGVDARGIDFKGALVRGVLTGAVKVQNVFGGKVDVTSLKTNLSEAQPNTEAAVRTDGVDVNRAITWFSPKWKDMVKGELYGTNDIFAPDSSRPDFLQKTRVQGNVELKNAFISTLQLDQMINKALSKIPGIGNKEALNSKGVAANMKAQYLFANAVMNLKSFSFLSPERNQVEASGTVDLAQNAKLSGTAFLATAPIGGSVKAANSDSSGRLVLPFELNGNLSDPSVSFAEKTVQKLAENTAKAELKSLQGRAKEEGKKELEKKLEELKKKGLKGLFGK